MAKKSEEKTTGLGLLGRLKKAAHVEYADVMSNFDEVQPREFISSGNYLLNCLLAADPNKGMPTGKIMTLAGPPGCGKTFTMFEIFKNAQKLGYTCVLYDSEFANNDKDALTARGIDIDNLLYIPIDTVENLKTSILNLVEEISPDDKVIIGIDSLGNLSTSKEMTDSIDGSDKKDMTRAAVMKALFRTITMKCGIKQIPVIGISHVYAAVGSFIPQNVVGGGSGIQYMSSIVIQMSKAQDKDSAGVVGAVVTAKTDKNRFAKEKSKVKFTINFNTGMNPYSGLLGFFEEEKVFKKEGRSYVYNGEKYGPKQLNKEFWDKELQGNLGEYLKNKFRYCSITDELGIDDVEGEEDD